jgi:hypothetical protein
MIATNDCDAKLDGRDSKKIEVVEPSSQGE